MAITSSVGVGGKNVAGDVMYVQLLLNDARMRSGLPPIAIDGLTGPETESAIRAFQALFTPSRDGRVDPNGPTISALEDAHLLGVLSGRFADYVRNNPRVRLNRDIATTNGLFQLYLKTLRDGLN